MKGGGLSSVIKEADAKKQGIVVIKPPAHKTKATATTQDFVDPSSAKKETSAVRSNKGSGIPAKSPMKRPTTGAKPTGVGLKPKPSGASNQAPSECQLDGDLSEDPIAQSLSVRV